jgi:predicted nucleic acid-binding Zn ribbon protein
MSDGRGNIDNLSKVERFIPGFDAGAASDARKKARIIQIHEAWESSMPAEILNHTDNVYLYKEAGEKKLTVYVDQAAWAAELNASRYRIQKILERKLGEKIDKVEFIVSSIGYRTRTFKKRHGDTPSYAEPAKPASIEEGEMNEFEDELSVIEDERLKESLLKARVADTAWKKGIKASKWRQNAR